MNAQQHAYVLPLELHQVLAVERISVSPTGEPPGQGADFYAFVFDLGQDDAVNAFGGTPTEAVANVLTLLGKPYVLVDADEYIGLTQQCEDISYCLSRSAAKSVRVRSGSRRRCERFWRHSY